MPKLKFLALSMIWCWSLYHEAVADPQTLLLNTGCSSSTHDATNLPIFIADINGMFCDLRSQVSDQSKNFATAQIATGEIVAYAMFQCRNYLSKDDCLACFNTASSQIREVCSAAAAGARVIYDGCFLRYESEGFFNQTTAQGNGVVCGNQAASESAFSAVGLQVLMDLQTKITRNKGFLAATTTQVAGGAIYAIAECVETITESGCQDCLKVGFNDIQSCLPNSDGRAFDAGCFIRYSNTSFFDDQQTNENNPRNKKRKRKKTNRIKRFFKKGLPSNKWGIIGSAAATALVVTPLGILAGRKISKTIENGNHKKDKIVIQIPGPIKVQYGIESPIKPPITPSENGTESRESLPTTPPKNGIECGCGCGCGGSNGTTWPLGVDEWGRTTNPCGTSCDIR